MSWETPVPIFEDEDEDALISKFVEMSAAYPNYSPMTIANHVFANLKDPTLRANQAAVQWSGRLDILERIRIAKLNGCREPKPLTQADLQAKYLALAEDDGLTSNEKKARKDIYDSIMRLNGWEKKAADAGDDDKNKRHFPQIVFAVAEPSRVSVSA
jgi:hypothetical protein